MKEARDRFQHLDMLRGLCALGVVVSHVRSLLIVPYAEAQGRGLGELLLFTIGGLGHECVIVFFSASGYFVGGSAFAAMRDGRFSWGAYGAARLSRLWTVLVPALILTALLDAAGAAFGPPGAYDGALAAIIPSGPTPAEPANHSISTFFGNLFFLQTVATPVFGSNRALWSLSNEACYYLAFPLIAFGLLRGFGKARLAFAAAGVFVLASAPTEMALLGIPWIAGAFAAARPTTRAPLRAILVGAASVAAIAFAHASRTLASDIVLGCVVSFGLRELATFAPIGGLYARAATGLSNISYTLYAVHYPLALALWFVLLAPVQSQPGPAALAQMAAFIAAALAYASVIWFLFERRTEAVRRAMKRLPFLAGARATNASAEARQPN
ncbi:acyltransferase [Methylosinus sp. Sm6]|uniref:acyltransferase family protein n=1 Tax=Methylosinus sp. Sm6 TaxID=2866948 RepID=UPI001C99B389|nr:acyltransferase [Methylosinus sp. Sm6]MBY6243985.1 acyltransferase [Methylosinus sp. Sm6]